ncbi:MAG: polysaccharide export protein [Opitutae bacterium]|jgi:polysaccharide export outer membrane protein|nr:polysaccharide export protein [Opitutae bacterium]
MKYIYSFSLFLVCLLAYGQESSNGNFSYGSSESGGSNNTNGGNISSNFGIVVDENYVLKPSDVIRISVFLEPDLEKSVRIEADGTVTLPLIKKVKVANLSISDAQDLITQLYNRDYLVDPQISLLVVSFSPKIVRILGSVNRPGVVEMPPDREMTLTEAIASANGVSRLGNPKSITIKRVDESGKTEQFEVNFNRILMNANAKDMILKEGDTIWVPERII